MKHSLTLLAVGILLGLACKWGFGGFGEADGKQPNVAASNEQARESGDASGSSKPDAESLQHGGVVPPIQLAGRLVGALLETPTGHVAAVDAHGAEDGQFKHDNRAVFHPHGEQVCASGCALSRHPTKELKRDEYHALLAGFAGGEMDEKNLAFETLLYYGRQTKQMMQREGTAPLDSLRVLTLENELKKTHAFISIRVVDEQGEIRSWLPPTRVPLDRRHEFIMDVNNVQPLMTSGTVKRVGLYHLWTRL